MEMIQILEQKNGVIQLPASLTQQIDSLVATFPWTSNPGCESISRNLKAQLRADSSGNWELKLLIDSASSASRIVHS